jgi:hypothetical protein
MKYIENLKMIVLLAIIGVGVYFGIIFLFANTKKNSLRKEYIQEYKVQIRYNDNTLDTLNFTSECYPEMNIRNGVSIFHTCWGTPLASYVKSFKVLSEKKVDR